MRLIANFALSSTLCDKAEVVGESKGWACIVEGVWLRLGVVGLLAVVLLVVLLS